MLYHERVTAYEQTDPMLRRILGQCHVGKTNREAIRFVIGRLRRGYKTWKKTPKATRREAMRQIILIHGCNFAEYAMVMSGRY